jgi:hypothetical protein
MARLRSLLESLEISDLEVALVELQESLKALHGYPNGMDGVSAAIKALPDDRRGAAMNRLEQIRLDHEVNSGLIKFAMQRNAALQAYAAQIRPDATYSSDGGVPFAGSGELLGKV